MGAGIRQQRALDNILGNSAIAIRPQREISETVQRIENVLGVSTAKIRSYQVQLPRELPVQAGLVILGDLSVQGNIKPLLSLAEPLQVAMDNGARKALIPLGNKRNFLEVSGDIVERVDPVFFSDPMTAAIKALGIT